MVDWAIEAEQDCWHISLQLCRNTARSFSTCEQIDKSDALKQHTESDEQCKAEIKTLPQTLRGILKGTAIHQSHASRRYAGYASTSKLEQLVSAAAQCP
jgi:hypothetical protein